MRRTLVATTGVLALAAGLVVPTGAALAANTADSTAAVDAGKRTGVKVTLKGPKTEPVAGDAVKVKGKAKVKEQPIAKAKVKLLRKKGSKWVFVGKTKTNKKGKYRKQVSLPNKPKMKLRAKLVKPTRVKGTTSNTLTVRFTQPATGGNPTPVPTSPTPVVTVPDAPTRVAAVASDGEVALSWTAPANDGGSAITSYRATANTGATVTSTTTTATFPGLTNGTLYTFSVVANNTAGTSSASAASNEVSPYDPSICVINGQPVTTVADGIDNGPLQSAVTAAGATATTITVQGTCHDYNIDIAAGQAITLRGLPTGSDTNHTIDANRNETNQGSGIRNGGDLTIDGDLTLKGGYAGVGGGIENTGTLILDGNVTIRDNTAQWNGGGIYNDGGKVTLNGGTISGNTADEGGGIHNDDWYDGVVELKGGTVTGNSAHSYGGGIYNYSGWLTIDAGSAITHNTAGKEGGGVFHDYAGSDNATKMIVRNGSIRNNQATEGGGISVPYGAVELANDAEISGNVAEDGGGISVGHYGTLTLSPGSTVSENEASNGGGIYNYEGTVTLNGGDITGNDASSSGGGIYNESDGHVTVNGGSIANNEAQRHGGGVYNAGWSLTLNGGQIVENIALANGGGIYNEHDLHLITDGGTISNNTANGDGGGIFNTWKVWLDGAEITQANPDWNTYVYENAPQDWSA
jgi:hypothetical protein